PHVAPHTRRRWHRLPSGTVDSTIVIAFLGIAGTLAGALGTRWPDFRQQDRVWNRAQRLEAHHAFLNQVNRLTATIAAFTSPTDPTTQAEAMSDVRDVLDRTVDAFNRVELVCSSQLHDLAVKILEAADAEQLRRPGQVPAVLQAIGVASRNY